LSSVFHHLHVHDEYSIRDSFTSVEEYAYRAKEIGLSALAITNHGHLGQIIRQENVCNELDLKPIFGCEFYVNDFRMDDSVRSSNFTKFKKNNHLLLMVKNEVGLRNLIKINNDAWINGHYYKPRTDTDFILEHSDGLICSTACMGGQISRLIREGEVIEAEKVVDRYKKAFGDDYYIELIFSEYRDQVDMNRKLYRFADSLGLPMIITCDCHYLDLDDSEAHDVMLLIQGKKTISDLSRSTENVWQFEAKDLWFKPYDEVLSHYRRNYRDDFSDEKFMEIIQWTNELAERIENIHVDRSYKFPYYKDENETIEDLSIAITKDSYDGIHKRLDGVVGKEHVDRLMYELDIIKSLGFQSFFLVLAEIVNYAKGKGILVGPGRGSAAGSLVCYALGITDIDSIKHDLLFERFMSLDRMDPPDIDVDFEPDRRDEVKDFIVNRFGEDKTSSIGTYSTFKIRSAIADVSRVFEVDYDEVRKATRWLGRDSDNMTFEEIFETNDDLYKFFGRHQKILDIVKRIRGKVNNLSTHAAGMIIGRESIIDVIPMMRQGENVMTAWQDGVDYRELTSLGYLKFDILGLNNLAIIKTCLELLKEQDIEIDFEQMPLDDEKALKIFDEGKTHGIFQFETDLMKSLAMLIGVSDFSDLVAINALGRPGPLRAGMVDSYSQRKNHPESYHLGEGPMREILSDTHGIILFQEQVMQLAEEIGGFSPVDANHLRKALIKFQGDENLMGEYKEKFILGAQDKELSAADAVNLWNLMFEFAGYGFNKAHATSYSLIAYYEAYLKSRYLIEYNCAVLINTKSGESKGESKLRSTIHAVQKEGIKILPPDINKSKYSFVVEGDAIRFGLGAIKNLGGNLGKIINGQPYRDIYDFVNRMTYKVANKKVMDSLISGNALSDFGAKEKLFNIYYKAMKKKKNPYTDLLREEWLLLEYKALSLVLSEDLYERYSKEVESYGVVPISEVAKNAGSYNIICRIVDVKERMTKRGKPYAVIKVLDDADEIDLISWSESWERYKNIIKPGNEIGVVVIKHKNSNNLIISSEKSQENVLLLNKDEKASTGRSKNESAESSGDRDQNQLF